jgi:uncharacterized protein YjdB
MKKIFYAVAIMLMITKVCSSQSPTTFKHPGIFSSQAQLDFIKSTVAANNGSPIVSGYQTLANDSKGSLSYNPEPYAVVAVVASGSGPEEAAFRRDAHAAYIHAVKWVVTGNTAYRDKSIQILNAWSYAFQSMYCTDPNKPNQTTLEASWALPIWLAGAEIIKTYNGGSANWASADVSKFDSYVRKILTYVNGQIASAPNWYISKGLSLMAAGVYLNESGNYNAGYNIIVPQLDAITTSGQIPELTRDFVHSQYVLIGLTQAAEVAYQQGSNALFTRTNGASQPRLLLGAESYTRCLLGTNTPNYQSASEWARKSAPYEILLLRYNQLGMSVPNVQNYVVNQNRSENGAEDHFLGWLTATHSALAPATVQTPYSGTPVSIPGTIEAENFDKGGEGVAYHDLESTNQGGQYRTTEGADIEVCGEGGYNIGWTGAGEWLEYTVDVPATGNYNIDVRIASPNTGGTFHIEFGGVNKTGTMTAINTGGWQTWATISKTNVALSAGVQVMRVFLDNPNFNINKITISTAGVAVTGVTVSPTSQSLNVGGSVQLTATVAPSNASNKNVTWSSSNTSAATVSSTGVVTATGTGTAVITVTTQDGGKTATCTITVGSLQQTPYNGTPASIPGIIEAENYDNGGQDIAYNDITDGNNGNVYRSENVDIQPTTDTGGGYAIGWIAAGEWLEYTVNVNTPGTYTLTARVSATMDAKSFHVELDGQNISGTIPVTNTGSYQTYATVTVTTPSLTTGQKVLRIVMDATSFNINYLGFASNASSSNIALNKTATASSIEAAGFEASNAVDGSGTTRWSSAFSDPQWIQVDLGANYSVNRVKITWEPAYASSYQILISSDGSAWATMRSVSGNTSLVNDQTGLSGTGRYIRINGTARGTVYGYSIYELEVYGNFVSARSIKEEGSALLNDSENLSIKTFPNPVTETVTVHAGKFWMDGNISLVNITGKSLFSETIKSSEHTFNLQDAPTGLYIIKIAKGNRATAQKIIKK